jgi:hypothetical protein
MRIPGIPRLGSSIVFEDIYDRPDFTVKSFMIRISLIRDVDPHAVALLEPSHTQTFVGQLARL